MTAYTRGNGIYGQEISNKYLIISNYKFRKALLWLEKLFKMTFRGNY